jgi:hypothetical protein
MLTGAACKIAPQDHPAGSVLTKVARVACKETQAVHRGAWALAHALRAQEITIESDVEIVPVIRTLPVRVLSVCPTVPHPGVRTKGQRDKRGQESRRQPVRSDLAIVQVIRAITLMKGPEHDRSKLRNRRGLSWPEQTSLEHKRVKATKGGSRAPSGG